LIVAVVLNDLLRIGIHLEGLDALPVPHDDGDEPFEVVRFASPFRAFTFSVAVQVAVPLDHPVRVRQPVLSRPQDAIFLDVALLEVFFDVGLDHAGLV
jgi:hypothetical protein